VAERKRFIGHRELCWKTDLSYPWRLHELAGEGFGGKQSSTIGRLITT
jgi:hypothetical protein